MNVRKNMDVEKFFLNLCCKKFAKRGLSRISEVDKHFGYPSRSFKSIHVAGTNGKGSVSVKIAHGLTVAGYKTGLFVSPHIYDICERIQVDGKNIERAELERITNFVSNSLGYQIPFFEYLFIVAIMYFRHVEVDYAVIEVGIGGLLDTTNIISPTLSVITNVGFDHTNILGKTLDEIAINKAGIIKRETPLVLGHNATLQPVLRKAFLKGSPIYFVPPFMSHGFMRENCEIAKNALAVITGCCLSIYALEDINLPCRFEIKVFSGVTFVFDMAHNMDGISSMFESVKAMFKDRKLFVIFGVSSNKDIKSLANILNRYSTSVFVVDVDHMRLAKANMIKNFIANPSKTTSVSEFVTEAKKSNGIVIVTGSAFIMKDVNDQIITNFC